MPVDTPPLCCLAPPQRDRASSAPSMASKSAHRQPGRAMGIRWAFLPISRVQCGDTVESRWTGRISSTSFATLRQMQAHACGGVLGIRSRTPTSPSTARYGIGRSIPSVFSRRIDSSLLEAFASYCCCPATSAGGPIVDASGPNRSTYPALSDFQSPDSGDDGLPIRWSSSASRQTCQPAASRAALPC
jgi:hypothetical protein